MDQSNYYEAYWTEQGFNPRNVRLPSQLVEVMNEVVEQGSSCLDIGCGTGAKVKRWVEAKDLHYTGVDVSATAIKELRDTGLQGIQVNDPALLPFPDSSFDVAICLEVLEHLFDPVGALKEAFRVIRPGGHFVATVPNSAHLRIRLQLLRGVWNPNGDDLSIDQPWRDPHIRFFTRTTLAAVIQRADFCDVEVGGHTDTTPVDDGRLPRSVLTKNPIYARLRLSAPSLFAGRLHAIARKPE